MASKKTLKPTTARRKTVRRKKASGGRRTKLTPAVFSAVVEAVRAGSYLQAAAGAGGVSANTVGEWIRRGESRENNGRESTPLYAKFAKALREAEAEAERRAVSILSENLMGYSAQTKEVSEVVDNAGNVTGRRSKITERTIRDPRSAIEFLRRRFPERWGDREKHKHDHTHQHEHVVMSPEDKAIASRVASARLRRTSRRNTTPSGEIVPAKFRLLKHG